MKEKAMWAAIAALVLLSAGQAYYIFKHNSAAPERRQEAAQKTAPDPWKELEAWRNSVRSRLLRGDPLAAGDFDGFFNEGFFGRRFSAFEEMERIHQQMLAAFGEPERGAFGESWDKWFAERMEMAGFRTRVYGGKQEVVMIIEIPGLEKANADISVTRDRVRLAFSARSSAEEKRGGSAVKRELARNFVKILPVPEGADGAGAKISMLGDSVRITFPVLRKK